MATEIDYTVQYNGHNIADLVELYSTGPNLQLQKLEEKASKAQDAFEKEEKMRKELEALNSKLLAEKTALLDSLSGEKGALQDYQEKAAKLTAQKNDIDNQLRVSIPFFHHIHLRNFWKILLKISQFTPFRLQKKNKNYLILFTLANVQEKYSHFVAITAFEKSNFPHDVIQVKLIISLPESISKFIIFNTQCCFKT
jgi:hypothetical protein